MLSVRITAFAGAVLCCWLGWGHRAAAQPASVPSVSGEQARAIGDRLERLVEAMAALPDDDTVVRWLPDVEICAKAAEWIVRHGEFSKPGDVDDTLAALALGLERATALREQGGRDRPSWSQGPGTVVLAYRSRVDGSVQPYAVTLPEGGDADSSRRWPLVIKLHGRHQTLNEVRFIRQHQGKPLAEPRASIQLDVFGRTNNAYRWSGETDVFEALADVRRRFPIDARRITLWGFSMGGAGAWHLGLHHPSLWSSVGAGAGFVDFYAYQNHPERLPEYQHRTLHIYDAVDYATNLANVPFITYGGEQDKQLAASLTVKLAALKQNVPLRLLVGPGMGHKFDNASFAAFMAFHAEHAAEGRPERYADPKKQDLRFVTYTPKYNRCEWLTVIELDELYVPATATSRVDEDGILHLTTSNITALRIARGVAGPLMIDQQGPFTLPPENDRLPSGENVPGEKLLDDAIPDEANFGETPPGTTFVRNAERWKLLDAEQARHFATNPQLRKRHNLQGPIDDAFMQPFVCVRGTGIPWSQPLHDWSEWTLGRFEREFDKWLRGRVPVVNDVDLTDEQIAGRNLVLFGDPGSNAVLSRIVDRLPVAWTRERLTVHGQPFDPATHGVALIFPNPLNPERYVVVNSGHTFHERDFRASNSWLFPKRGDMAVVRFERKPEGGYQEQTVWADLFDADWRLPE